MKKQEKKFVLAALALLAITGLLALAGCKNDSVPEPTRYTVKFDKGDNSEYTGDLPADITVESRTKLTAEQLKVLDSTDNYIFEGWYDGENKAEGGTYTVTKDVTLVAKWRERGVTAEVSFSVDENGRVVLSSETKDAVIYYTINGSGPDENSSKYGEPIEISAQTTVRAYAQGTGMKPSDVVEKTYLVVTFNADGGSEVVPQIVESGNAATKPTDPTNGDMVLAGWYTSEDDGTTLADTAYSFDAPVAGDITFYAWWLPKPGTVVKDALTINNVRLEKTSEVQVLSGEVDLSSLEVSSSEVFISGRSGTIKPFVMGQYEVTQQLYSAVMGKWGSTEPSNTYGKGDEYPAYYVSWYDAVVFCNELTKKVLDYGDCVYYSDAGLTTVYTTGDVTDGKTPYMDISKSGYRLPTEAEWELAARGGNAGAGAWQYTYAGSDTIDDVAWYNDSKTHQVGTKEANSLGLYDMSGNVWEWCWDWHDSIEAGTASGGAASGSGRFIRGGSWLSNAGNCSVSRRDYSDPSNRNFHLGFRLVRSAN